MRVPDCYSCQMEGGTAMLVQGERVCFAVLYSATNSYVGDSFLETRDVSRLQRTLD